MNQPVLLLLDVDGVLNALGRPLPERPTYCLGRARSGRGSYEIAWAPEAVARILALHSSGAVEVRWLTTWGHDANGSLRQLLGMPELAVAGTFDGVSAEGEPGREAGSLAAVTPAARDGLTGRWWKFDVVAGLLAEDPVRRLVWLDDDLAEEDDLARWTRLQTDALILAPDPLMGLSRHDLQTVEAFCRVSPGG